MPAIPGYIHVPTPRKVTKNSKEGGGLNFLKEFSNHKAKLLNTPLGFPDGWV